MSFTPEHTLFRDNVRAFVEREIAPNVNAWDEAQTFPRELYTRASALGLLGLGYPEAYGGTPCDAWFKLIATEEIARAGSGGLMASLFSHNMGLPPINAHGSDELKCSDIAHLRFDNCRVPIENLIGEENQGFRAIMENFNGERLLMSAGACTFAQVCFDEALAWARERKTFGVALARHQVLRHKLMDMRMRIASTRAWLHALVEQQERGDTGPEWVAELCLLKNHATPTMQWCADAAVQILGGMGFMRGVKSERIYREVKVMMIGGGTEEIMKELAARQLGV